MNKQITLPRLLGAGIYDAAAVHKNVTETKARRTAVFEIELPVSNGGFSFIDGVQYPILTDCLICAKPGQMRRTRLPFRCYYVHLLIADGELYDFLSASQNHIKVSDVDKYRNILQDITDAYVNPFEGSEIYLQSRLLLLIYLLRTDSRSDTQSHTSENPSVTKAIQYMDKHCLEPVTLEEIARHVNLSRTYFHSLFTTAMGITPLRYILQKKLSAAKNALLLGDKSISEVAYETGFSSQSYFNYVFKKESGMTPCQYRKLMYNKYPHG